MLRQAILAIEMNIFVGESLSCRLMCDTRTLEEVDIQRLSLDGHGLSMLQSKMAVFQSKDYIPERLR